MSPPKVQVAAKLAKKQKTVAEPEHVPVPAKPDRKAHAEQKAKLEDEIAGLYVKIEEAYEVKEVASWQQRDAYNLERNAIETEIQILGKILGEATENKKKLSGLHRLGLDYSANDKEEVKKHKQEKLREWLAKIRQEREKNPDAPRNKEDLEKKIREKEFMQRESRSLLEEKKIVQEISLLKRMRGKVIDDIGANNAIYDDIMATRKERALLAKQGQQAWNAKDKAWGKYEALEKKNEENREALKASVRDLKAELQKKKEEKRKLDEAFRTADKKRRDWEETQRQLAKAENKRLWEEERELQRKTALPAFFEDLTLVEQTIAYLKSVLPKEETETKVTQETVYDNPEGCVVLVSKKDRDLDDLCVKKKKAPKKKVRTTTLNHTVGTYRYFELLKISAPLTLDDVPQTLETLESMREKYSKDLAEWRKKVQALV